LFIIHLYLCLMVACLLACLFICFGNMLSLHMSNNELLQMVQILRREVEKSSSMTATTTPTNPFMVNGGFTGAMNSYANASSDSNGGLLRRHKRAYQEAENPEEFFLPCIWINAVSFFIDSTCMGCSFVCRCLSICLSVCQYMLVASYLSRCGSLCRAWIVIIVIFTKWYDTCA